MYSAVSLSDTSPRRTSCSIRPCTLSQYGSFGSSSVPTPPGRQTNAWDSLISIRLGASLAQDAGSEMLYPFLPTFITGVLGAPVVLGRGALRRTAAGMKPVAGRFSRAGRPRPWIAAGVRAREGHSASTAASRRRCRMWVKGG